MSELRETLDNLPIHTEDIPSEVFSAARRWDELTSDENVEHLAIWLVEEDGASWDKLVQEDQAWYSRLAHRILEAVRRETR